MLNVVGKYNGVSGETADKYMHIPKRGTPKREARELFIERMKEKGKLFELTWRAVCPI